MSITIAMPELTELQPKITVIGVGGAGGNAVNNMVKAQLQGVSFICANTDAQALAHSTADLKVQLGAQLTQGLGAGARPDVGRAAAEETLDQVEEYLAGSHMVFVTAGMGGGTGTGAAPVIAKAAREKGILTVGVVTKPFQFEGSRRMALAEKGIEELQKYVDTLIIIPNQNLFRIANEKTTFADAFSMADEVLHSGVRGVTDLIVMPGLVNLDFADVRTVMSEMGKAMMGTGEAEGENRALEAAEAAISNPLLDEVSMKGARGVLINITGGMDLTLFEVDEAANRIRAEVDPDANILVGSALNEELNGRMRVSVVATGIDANMETATVLTARQNAPANVVTIDRTEEAPAARTPTLVERATEANRLVRTSDELVLNEEVAEAAAVEPTAAELKSEDAFISPEPMMPKAAPSSAPSRQPDPFAEAALANGPVPETSEKSGLGWFERMRNVTRRPAREEPSSSQPRLARPEPEEAAPVAQVQPAADQGVDDAGVATIGRVGPQDRITPSRNKLDDQLEIPTFLRRQAN